MTGIRGSELALQRRLTKAFIEADAQEVVLLRSAVAADGEGGEVRGVPTPLAPQTMRIIPLQDGASAGNTTRLTADGEAVRPSYMLMGTYDADMQRHDTYSTADGRYEVVFVNANRQYEVKGEVAYLGA